MLTGAIVPHAPVLAVGANSDGLPAATRAIKDALEVTRSIVCEVVILVGPHGRGHAVYRHPAGSLEDFGVPHLRATATGTEISAELAAAWGVPQIDGTDHGIVVPLLLGALPAVPVVACTLEEWTGASTPPGHDGDPRGCIAAAVRLGDAIASLAEELAVLVLCSAHTSAGLSPRAPLTERTAGKALDDLILTALRGDPGALGDIPAGAWAAGGACGAGPLTLFGRLFARRPVEVVAYEAPVGVGYLVARLT